MMTFKQLIRENYGFLLRKLDCSHKFLGELQCNEAIRHKIANINEQPVDRVNALLTALLDVTDHLQDDLMKDMTKALRFSGQDHIADIFCGSGTPASDGHYGQLQRKMAELCKYMDPDNGLLIQLISAEVVGLSEVERIRCSTGPNEMSRKLVEIFMKKSDGAFMTLITALNEVGQTHVACILTDGEGNMPLSQKLRERLISKRNILVTSIYSKGLVSVLMARGVFTEYDQQRVECRRTENEKNEKILDLLVRKSQSDFYSFIAALDETKQSHVVVELMGAEIAANVSMILANSEDFDEEDLETELREVMKKAFKTNETGIERLNSELQATSETFVKGVEEGSIIIKLLCKNVDKLREQYYSGKLDTLFTGTFCRPLASRALKSISLKIADRQFQQCAETLTAQKLMTSEHREALASSARYLVDKMTVSGDLLNKLSLCELRRRAIEAAATHEERMNTLLDVVSRQPDSAFTRLLDALTDTGQGQCASIIRDRTAWNTAKDSCPRNSKFDAVDEAGREAGAVTQQTDECQNRKSLKITEVSEDEWTTATQPIPAHISTQPASKRNQTSDIEKRCSTFDVILPSTDRVYGVTSLHGNLYVLRADCIDIYTTTNCYEHLSRRYVEGLKAAEWNDLTCSELHNSLYVADNAKKMIRAVPLEGPQRDWVVPDCPCGVSVTRDDTLLVTCADIRQLLELSLHDGDCFRRTPLSPGIERPWHAVKLISGHYVVSHSTGRGLPGQHRACVVDSDGSILFHYGAQPGSGMGQLNWPCHLSHNTDELVFVADSSNNRIVLLTRDMQFMRHYVGSLSHPRRLHLERETRRLYISELRGRVVVVPLNDRAPFYCPSTHLVPLQSRRFSA